MRTEGASVGEYHVPRAPRDLQRLDLRRHLLLDLRKRIQHRRLEARVADEGHLVGRGLVGVLI